MTPSSHVKDATYNDATRTMLVTFKGGEVYEFENVAKDDYKAFHSASSAGLFFRQWIVPRYGNGRRIRG